MFKSSDIKIGIVWRLIEVVGAEFFAFCSFLILTRLLAPEHFGVVALATILILIAQLVLIQGIGEALVQIEDVQESWFSSGLWTNFGLASFTALILFAGAPYIAAVFSEPRFAAVLRAIAPLLLIYSVSGILQAKLRRDLKLKGFAFASIFATILGAIVAAIMAIKGFEVWSLVGQQWTYAIISTTMFFYYTRWLPAPVIHRAHLQRFAGFSFNTVGAALLRFSLRQLDLLFLGLYLPSKQVGLYFLATRILNTVGQLTYYSIQRLGLPVLARLQHDAVRQRAATVSTLRLTCLVCLPVYLGMATTADLVVPIVFGDEWLGSIPPFRTLALFSIFYGLSLIVSQILLSAGWASTAFQLTTMNAIVFAAAVALAAPHGIVATAVAGGVANAVCLPVYFIYLKRKLLIDIAHIGADLLPLWTAATAMVLAVIAARYAVLNNFAPVLNLVGSIATGVLVFGGAVWLLRRDYVDELTTIVLGDRRHNHSSS